MARVDQRSFITVVDTMDENPKVEPLSDAAFRLLVTLWLYCHRQNNDGRLSKPIWSRRGTAKARKELLDGGLVHEEGDAFVMHDYLEHQSSKEERAETSAKRAEAGRLGGQAKAKNQAASKVLANASDGAKQNGSKDVPEVEVEEEVEEQHQPSVGVASRKRSASTNGTRLPEGWTPSRDVRESMASECPGIDLAAEHRKFVDYWAAIPGAKGRKVDWTGTWRNWIRNAHPKLGGTNHRQQQTNDQFARFAAWASDTSQQEISA